MNCCLNSSNLGHKSIQCVKLIMLLLTTQHVGKSSNTNLLFYIKVSQLILPIQKKKKKKKKKKKSKRKL